MNAFAGLLMVFILAAAPVRAAEDCSQTELPAGTVLKDGTIAGESAAFAYFREHEPILAGQLMRLDSKQMRDSYGKYLVWFQRVGPCRRYQKAQAIKSIKADLRLKEIAQRYVENGKSWPSPDAKAEATQLLSEQFDSETTMMESQLDALQKSAEDLQNQITALSRKIQERRQSRDASIGAELEAALK